MKLGKQVNIKYAVCPLLTMINKIVNKKLLLILILTLVYYLLPIENLGNRYTICLYKTVTGNDCITCGITRAFWCILHFNFDKAIHYNKLSLILIVPTILGIISWIYQINILQLMRKIKKKI